MPSRFLADIPQDLLAKPDLNPRRGRLSDQSDRRAPQPPSARADQPTERIVRQPDTPVIRRRSAASAPAQGARPALNTGDRVRHKTFGEGIVTEAKAARGDTEVTVAFKDGHGVKRLLLSFAPLEKVE